MHNQLILKFLSCRSEWWKFNYGVNNLYTVEQRIFQNAILLHDFILPFLQLSQHFVLPSISICKQINYHNKGYDTKSKTPNILLILGPYTMRNTHTKQLVLGFIISVAMCLSLKVI